MTLKDARLARGLSQRELAAQSRVGITTIYKAECRGKAPHPVLRESIARALGVSSDELWPQA